LKLIHEKPRISEAVLKITEPQDVAMLLQKLLPKDLGLLLAGCSAALLEKLYENSVLPEVLVKAAVVSNSKILVDRYFQLTRHNWWLRLEPDLRLKVAQHFICDFPQQFLVSFTLSSFPDLLLRDIVPYFLEGLSSPLFRVELGKLISLLSPQKLASFDLVFLCEKYLSV
jgi:hypothetical protein